MSSSSTSSSSTPCQTDPNVVLLLHMDGAQDSQVFTDVSQYEKAVTVFGTTKVDQVLKKIGSGSCKYTSGESCLDLAASTDWNFGTGNFTIEGWFYLNAQQTVFQGLFGCDPDSGTGWQIVIAPNERRLSLVSKASGTWQADVTTTGSIAATSWTHIAVVRNGNTISIYFNGTADATTCNCTGYTYTSNGSTLRVGAIYATGYNPWIGQIDEVRITKGTAKYTGNFTPSGRAFNICADTLVSSSSSSSSSSTSSSKSNSSSSSGKSESSSSSKSESSSSTSSSSSSVIEKLVNGCYCKNGDYFNNTPVYSNGDYYLFKSDGKWAIAFSVTDNPSLWLFYSDNSYDPLNSGNVWNKGIGTISAGYFGDTCPAGSTSSSSSSASESSSSKSISSESSQGYSESSSSESVSSPSSGSSQGYSESSSSESLSTESSESSQGYSESSSSESLSTESSESSQGYSESSSSKSLSTESSESSVSSQGYSESSSSESLSTESSGSSQGYSESSSSESLSTESSVSSQGYSESSSSSVSVSDNSSESSQGYSESSSSSKSGSENSSESSISSSSSSSSSGDLWTLYGYLNVNINGSINNIYYIPLYTKGGSGSYTNSDRVFWGTIGTPVGLADYGYLSFHVNGLDYNLKVYTANAGTGCCSNLLGVMDLINPYTLDAYTYVNCNNVINKWMGLYK